MDSHTNYFVGSPFKFSSGNTFFCFSGIAILVLCEAGKGNRTFSGGTEQSAQVCPGSSSHSMAGYRKHNHYCCRHVCCHFRLHYESVCRLQQPGRRNEQIDIHSRWHQKRCDDQNHSAGLSSITRQQYESQYRLVSGRRSHWRVPCCAKRTGISDHLRIPGIQTGYGDYLHYSSL